jgi:hypothetical protein
MEDYVYVYGARPGNWGYYSSGSGFKISTMMVFTDVYHLGKHIISEWLKMKDWVKESTYRQQRKTNTFEEWIVELGRASPKVYKVPLNKEPDKRRPMNSKVLFEEMKNCEKLRKDFIKLMLKE